MKTLAPLRLKPSYWRDTERQVIEILRDLLFRPIVEAIRSAAPAERTTDIVSNAAADVLVAAIRSGRVQYSVGTFSGQFSAAITRAITAMGGKFDARSRTFHIDQAQVPSQIKAESAAYQTRAKDVHKLLRQKLDEIQKNVVHDINVRSVDAVKTTEAVEDGFKGAAKKLEVNPELSAASKAKLAEEYSDNLKLYIKKFADQEIFSLREAVEENAKEGYRFDKLIPSIKKRYGVTVRKAKFLARNETSIFMSKYHEERYAEAGITHYIWSTSHDNRVRPAPGTHGTDNHRILDGRTFSFAKPPTVDPATGRKANPGQDYNCRCIAIPILDDRYQEQRDYREAVADVSHLYESVRL